MILLAKYMAVTRLIAREDFTAFNHRDVIMLHI